MNGKDAEKTKFDKKPTQIAEAVVTVKDVNDDINELKPDKIQDHRLWSIFSLVTCFFLIAPCIAFYHSRRIRHMKENQELMRASILSNRINTYLVYSTFIGAIIWVAIIAIIAILFAFGRFL